MTGFWDLLHEAEFQFRNVVLSAPSLRTPATPSGTTLSASELNVHLAALRKDGITRIEQFLSSDQIARIENLMEATIAAGGTGKSAVDYSDRLKLTHIRNPLLLDDELAELAFNPDLIAIVEGYLRRMPKLVDVDMRRVHPCDAAINAENLHRTASCWHYDNRGRQIKIMFYLSDVGEGDQNFAFCTGTHKGLKMGSTRWSRFSDAWVAENVRDVREVYAPAGSAVIFDSNAIHRLRRKPSRARDTFTFYYHAGFTQIVSPSFPRRVYDRIDPRYRDTLTPVDA
jgi:hypothetical protein